MARNLDTALLRAFVAVAETAGMTAAAAVLHLTQAGVSQQIKRLEETFGYPLFERDRRGLRLTSAGERLFVQAKRMLALNDAIWAEMTTPLFEGEVRLGIPADVVNVYLPAFLKSFARAYPKVQLSLRCESTPRLLAALEAGELDLTLTTELGCGPGGEGLATDRLVWVGARGGEVHLQRPLPFSMCSETCAFRAPVLAALAGASIPWRPVSETSNMEAHVATAQADLTVLAMLASTVPSQLEMLGPASGLPPLPPFSINLYLPRTGGTDIARELARHVREGLREQQRLAA